MYIAIDCARPTFDTCKQPLDPGPVALDQVAVTRLLVSNQISLLVANPASIGILLEDRHKILCSRQDEDIRFLGVVVLRQPLVRLSRDCWQRHAPADTKRPVTGARVV